MNYLDAVKVNNTNSTSVEQNKVSEKPQIQEKIIEQKASDSYEISTKSPIISRTRLFFNRLTKEQIAQVNETGILPPTARFHKTINGGYKIRNKRLGTSKGTRYLPVGYELKKSSWGFTKVVPKETKDIPEGSELKYSIFGIPKIVPKGTTGLFLKKTAEEKEQIRADKIAYKKEKAQIKATKKAEKAAKKAEKAAEKAEEKTQEAQLSSARAEKLSAKS